MKVINVTVFALLIASLLLLFCDAKAFVESQFDNSLCQTRNETFCINLVALDDSKFLAASVGCNEIKTGRRLMHNITVEKCNGKESEEQPGVFDECSFPFYMMDGSKSRCVQKYLVLRNTSISDEKGVKIQYGQISIPAGCECIRQKL